MRSEKLIRNVLRNVSNKKLSIRKAAGILKGLPSLNLKFANIDCGRYARCGFPEVVYCEGKTVPQIRRIAREMLKHEGSICGFRQSCKQ